MTIWQCNIKEKLITDTLNWGFQLTSTNFMQPKSPLIGVRYIKAMGVQRLVVKNLLHCDRCIVGRNWKFLSLCRLRLLPCSLTSGSLTHGSNKKKIPVDKVSYTIFWSMLVILSFITVFWLMKLEGSSAPNTRNNSLCKKKKTSKQTKNQTVTQLYSQNLHHTLN